MNMDASAIFPTGTSAMVMVDRAEFERIAAKMKKPFIVLQKKRSKSLYLVSCNGFLFFTFSDHVKLPEGAEVMRAQKILVPWLMRVRRSNVFFR